VDYLGLLVWDHEQLAAMKKEDELPLHPSKLDYYEVLRLSIAAT
jgi:hypothetical protein